MSRLTRLAWVSLWWNLAVILMGAVVRATGSGAGCGRHWPTCHGEVIPPMEGATAVEFTHRLSSGVALVLVGLLVVTAFRSTPKGHPVRVGAVVSGVAIVAEALIGMMIVLYEWVEHDASVARAVSVPLHLVNTMVLLAGVTLTVFWSKGGGRLAPAQHPGRARDFLLLGVGMLVIGATGAVAALADTLFPDESLLSGLTADFAAGEHFLTRLRLLHPIIAIGVGVVSALYARWRRTDGEAAGWGGRFAAGVVMWVVGAQLVTGVLNVVLFTPLWMQVVHLTLADLLWIAWVWLAAAVLQPTKHPETVEA